MNEYCRIYGIADGARDVMFTHDGKLYAVTLGTSEYIESIKQLNKTLAEEYKADDNILLMEQLMDDDTLCKKLSSISWDVLQPYVTLQESVDD